MILIFWKRRTYKCAFSPSPVVGPNKVNFFLIITTKYDINFLKTDPLTWRPCLMDQWAWRRAPVSFFSFLLLFGGSLGRPRCRTSGSSDTCLKGSCCIASPHCLTWVCVCVCVWRFESKVDGRWSMVDGWWSIFSLGTELRGRSFVQVRSMGSVCMFH